MVDCDSLKLLLNSKWSLLGSFKILKQIVKPGWGFQGTIKWLNSANMVTDQTFFLNKIIWLVVIRGFDIVCLAQGHLYTRWSKMGIEPIAGFPHWSKATLINPPRCVTQRFPETSWLRPVEHLKMLKISSWTCDPGRLWHGFHQKEKTSKRIRLVCWKNLLRRNRRDHSRLDCVTTARFTSAKWPDAPSWLIQPGRIVLCSERYKAPCLCRRPE